MKLASSRRVPLVVMLIMFAVVFAPGASLSLGCGGGQESTEKPAVNDDGDDDDEVKAEGKKWGGWRWKGRRNDCFFVFKNECFATRKKACKRAGCSEQKCEHNEAAPAAVTCKKS